VQWGFNCRFGRGAQGDIELLRRYEGQCRFEVRQSEPVLLEGRPVSSTAIREAIAAGWLAEAAGMLGRRVSVLGTVVRGVGRGAAIGFPTANLDLHHETVPPAGVYACLAVVRGEPHVAVANIGSCPTFDPPKPADFVEVHVLDFDRAIYGEDVEVQFIRFLRGEAKFDSVEQLVEQIRRDVEATRGIAAEAL
jgi:riboflavin kinase/FMN adenylyltransferase